MYGWSPGIGDPTIFGWSTVVLYVLAALLCWRARAVSRKSRPIWTLLFCFMAVLGVNKQLDIQSLFTAVARHLAHAQGWYDVRQTLQREFILALSGLIVAFILWAGFKVKKFGWPEKMALIGAASLGGFVAIRAASFHHVDIFLGTSIASVRWNVVMEAGGILIIALAAFCAHAIKTRQRKIGKIMQSMNQSD